MNMFMIRFTVHQGAHQESIARFKAQTHLSALPSSVKVLHVFHGLGHGYVVIEAKDFKDVYKAALAMAHLYSFEIEPIMDDAGVKSAIA